MKELQERMFRLVTRREARAGDPALAGWIVARDDEEAADRLGVYAGMYSRRLVDTLAESFPRVRAELGAAAFEELSERYVEAHPSDDPNLRNFGRRFASYVPEEIAALARLEWAHVEAFDAEDATPIRRADLERLAPEAWPALSLALVPSARVSGDTLVWRRGFVVHQRGVLGGELRALRALHDGATFAGACEAFADEPRVILAALEQWLADELLTRPACST
jgi:hypothetical protein